MRFGEILAEPVRNGIYKKKEFHGRGCRIVNMGELFAYGFISNQEMRRVELNAKERSKYLLQDGDLLFARRSLVLKGSGKCSLVVNPSEPTTFESSMIRARLDQAKANPRFYYYFWGSPFGRGLMASIATRTAVSGIRGSDLVQLKVPVPPLPVQRKIAAVLSAYDDLIENNTRRIAILEEMAQAIYREWFVHFRFPGHEQVEMADSELGPIPEGWEVARFSDTVTLLRRGVTPSRFPDEVFAHYSFPAFDSACMPLPERGDTIRSGKYLVDGGNVLLSKLNPHIPRVWLPFPDSSHRAIASSEFLVLLPEKPFTRSYLYSLFQSADFLAHFASLTIGTSTSHQRVKPQDFLGMTTVLPPSILINALTDLVEPMFRAINLARLKNAALRRTRDLLLPRLISGELDVSDLSIDIGAGHNFTGLV